MTLYFAIQVQVATYVVDNGPTKHTGDVVIKVPKKVQTQIYILGHLFTCEPKIHGSTSKNPQQ